MTPNNDYTVCIILEIQTVSFRIRIFPVKRIRHLNASLVLGQSSVKGFG